MPRTLPRLLLTTALCLPLGTAAFAQSEAACDDLGLLLNDGLPESFVNDAERIETVQAAGDVVACEVEVVAIRAVQTETTAETEGAELTETEQMTVRLQDEIVVEGMVYLDRQPAQVDIQGGDTEVTVSNDQPEVTVNEGQANIVVRQAAANVVVEMPQPTIRIEQPAPEIIITMPEPGVDIANARPMVEVRQAEPNVTVTQAAPMVDLELRRAPEGAEASTTTITDRATGNTYASGETVEATTVEDATVNMASNEPTVVYQDGETRAPVVNRAEPVVSFESAEPQVQVTNMGEPQIELVQTGEPVVTFNQAAGAETPAPAADMPDAEVTEEEAMIEDEAVVDPALTEEAPVDPAMTEEAAIEGDAPEGDLVAITEDGEEALESDTAEIEADATTDVAADVNAEPVETDMTAGIAPDVARDGYMAMTPADMNIENLQGMSVYGINDEDVGEVGQVLVDADGTVQSLVLQVGGFLGLGERKVNVPMNMLTILRDDAGDIRVYVDSTEDKLENMPKYDG